MSLDMSSMAARSSSPLGSWKAAWSFLPYLASITVQPFAANISRHTRTRMPGMTRSRLWRLRSTTQRMFSASATAWSAIASQTTPSSSSASPSRLMYRRSTLVSGSSLARA